MFLKKIKKSVVLLGIIVAFSSSAYAANYSVPEELRTYGDSIYAQTRSRFGRSFSGYCGTYVCYQLRAMGIDTANEFRGNGNQWYSNFDNVEVTSGGYRVYQVSGGDCLDKVAQIYGNDLDNIVLSFPIQSGYSASNPGAGHALVIYKLKDGVAYYSESFSFGNHQEGTVIAEDARSLVERYSKRHGSPTGCVLLTKEEMSAKKYTLLAINIVQHALQNVSPAVINVAKFSDKPQISDLA